MYPWNTDEWFLNSNFFMVKIITQTIIKCLKSLGFFVENAKSRAREA